MKELNNYILEKLHLDKNINPSESSSMYCDIYDVHEGDTVLCLCKSIKKSINSINYVRIFVAKINNIKDDTLILSSIKTGKVIDEIKYKFEDHTKSSPHITGTFAFFKNGINWSAIMHKDKAIKLIDKQLKTRNINFLSGFRLDPGQGYTKQSKLLEIKDELENA